MVAINADSENRVLNKIAVVINNKTKYLSYSLEEGDEPRLKMSEFLKLRILGELYGWNVINIDEENSDIVEENILKIFE